MHTHRRRPQRLLPTLTKLLPLALLAIIAGACGSRPDSAALIEDARTAFESRNYDEAQALCDTILLRARGGEELSPVMACRVALMLVRLGEVSDLEDENLASAWQSLSKTFEAHPDSLAEIIRKLPPEDQVTLVMLSRINFRRDTTVAAEYPDEYQFSETEFGEPSAAPKP